MKRVIFTRHGKSSWTDVSLRDHDRPLKKRGRKDAALISKVLKREGFSAEMIYTSSAARAVETALIYKNELGVPFIQYFIDLYHASVSQILDFLTKIETNHEYIMLFGHNPAYTDLMNLFSEHYVSNVPTNGTFCVEFNCDKWANIHKGNGVLIGYWFPKNYK